MKALGLPKYLEASLPVKFGQLMSIACSSLVQLFGTRRQVV